MNGGYNSNQQLGDPVTSLHRKRSLRVVVDEYDGNLTSISAIDDSWRVEHCDAPDPERPGAVNRRIGRDAFEL